jgi:hypothetical protein
MKEAKRSDENEEEEYEKMAAIAEDEPLGAK